MDNFTPRLNPSNATSHTTSHAPSHSRNHISGHSPGHSTAPPLRYKKGMLAVLDIGNSKIVCMIAHSDGNTPPIIDGIGHQKAAGIEKGEVTDQAALAHVIGKTIEAAERMAGVNIHSVYVGISGGNQTSTIRQHKIATASGQVMLADIRRLLWLDFNQPPNADRNRTVLHRLPLAYTLDDATDISNPLGMHGKQLGVALSVVTADTGFIAAIDKVVRQNYLRLISLPVANAYASGLGALTGEERLNNATLIDIGAGCASLTHFSRGMLMYLDSIPYGGKTISRDIVQCLGVNGNEAERLKLNLHNPHYSIYTAGSSRPTNTALVNEIAKDVAGQAKTTAEVATGTGDATGISSGAMTMTGAGADTQTLPGDSMSESPELPPLPPPLTEIITARVEEICDMLFDRLDKAGFGRHIRPRLILVGGTAALPDIDATAGRRFTAHFNAPCKVTLGRPHGVIGLAEMNRTAAFASTAGLLSYGFIDYALEPTLRLRESGPFGRIAAWVKYYIWDSAQ